MNELLTMSATEMARRIKSRDISPLEALETHISRIEEVNPKINAVVVKRYDDARREAKEAESKLKEGRDDLPPLFGVPCTIKDTYAVKGLTWSGGVYNRKDLVADFNASVVDRIVKAGAIIMGKTNVPEAAMWCETYNTVYGRTNNPYDLTRAVGGSSGGEGAIVAASGSPFGLGSDIGGSIRYPSAFNGVAGHKPSGRLTPGTGHWPDIHPPLSGYCCYGPLARRVEDLITILPLIAGPDGKDEVCEERELKSPDSVDLSKTRVYFFDDNGQAAPDPEVRRAVSMAAGATGASGIQTEYWYPEGVNQSLQIWSAGMGMSSGPSMKEYLGRGKPIPVYSEMLKLMAGRSKNTFPALGAALIEGPTSAFKFINRWTLAQADDLRQRIEEKLGDNGALICPVFSSPAPKHTHIWLKFMGIGYSGLFNVLEFPSTIIPVFHRPDGVPVSVQVVARRFNDHVTLAVARAIEKAFGGWKPKEIIE